ncbi:olfactory receptor 6K3-like [Heptranchias perlo]|uniref:olfactory receptor 6K3-like n=1 Tax=Heptranchias perlo TaxID=212740 RepID=UPI0035598F74
MAESNQRNYPVTGFILVGFPGLQDLESRLCSLFLVVYILIVVGNVFVLYIVTTDKRLHAPMYFLLGNLAAMDVVLTSSVIPRMLARLISDAKIIVWRHCFFQMYFFHSMSAAKMFLFSLMAYDRSVAICNPHHYLSLTRDAIFVKMAGLTWLLGMSCYLPPVVLASLFPFCGANEVYNSFCELFSVMSLICTDAVSVKFLNLVLNVVLVLTNFVFIVYSFIKIAKSVNRIVRSERKKALSTCVALMVVMSLFFLSALLYSTIFYISRIPPIIGVASGILYVTLSPLVSPIIYILTAKEIKEQIIKLIRVKKIFPHVGSTVATESH